MACVYSEQPYWGHLVQYLEKPRNHVTKAELAPFQVRTVPDWLVTTSCRVCVCVLGVCVCVCVCVIERERERESVGERKKQAKCACERERKIPG